ncbi:hypothetical protein Q8G48_28410, partial [Klebsiella pneumoniae]|uniref:hypothetical protein n=1 Tax=Klebsiella pneumoniae TaxID=573 RepID=UPI0030140EF5
PAADPEARAARAGLALDRGDFEAAAALLAEGPGDHPAVARLRGRFGLLRHDAPAAIRAYQVVLAADPFDRSALFGLGTALKMVGDDRT